MLADHVFEKKEYGSKKTKKPVHTQLVLSISNYHFNREQQLTSEFKSCTLNDCNVAIKFSSSEFVTEKTVGAPYHFDRSGVVLPYSSFVALLKDTKFVKDFLPYLKKKFESIEGPLGRAPPIDSSEDYSVVVNGEVEGPQDVDGGDSDDGGDDLEGPVKKKQKKGSNKKIGNSKH